MLIDPARKIGPPVRLRAGAAVHGDLFVSALLLCLSLILVPAFVDRGAEYRPDFLAQLVNPWVLPALGLTWVLVCGSVDLSVWMGFFLGSAVGGSLIAAGAHPRVALAGVLISGLVLGAVNAALVARLRLPGWSVTAVTALIAFSAARALTGADGIDADLTRWTGGDAPLTLNGSLYAGAMLILLMAGHLRPGKRTAGRDLSAALIASGVLSALGGLCWLAKAAHAPAPVWPVGDLRVAAAAVLAGPMLLKRPGGALLAGLLVPLGMLLATIWRECVWDIPAGHLYLNVLVLMIGAGGAQWALRQASAARRRRAWLWVLLAGGGVLLLAGTIRTCGGAGETALRLAGAAAWTTGMVAAAGERLIRRQAARHRHALVEGDPDQRAGRLEQEAGRDRPR